MTSALADSSVDMNSVHRSMIARRSWIDWLRAPWTERGLAIPRDEYA
jgi:hypothetical protein